jgi:hypothetical protein
MSEFWEPTFEEPPFEPEPEVPVEPGSEPQEPEHLIPASITYLLSETGRRDSRRKGGNGRRVQEMSGFITENDLDAFRVNDEGQVSVDARTLECDPWDTPSIIPAEKGRLVGTASFAVDEIQWDVAPSWEDLLAVARAVKEYAEAMAAEAAEGKKQRDRITQEFIDNPSARATSIERDHVMISGYRFENVEPAAAHARKRWNADQEEIKRSNRATLREWISRIGTENQCQRLLADLLPWKEAYETVEEHLFDPLKDFPLYRRFEPGEVKCVCEAAGEFTACEPKFQSLDATELTADEWDQFCQIKAAVPGAMFQLREHRAQCRKASAPEIRRGVIVKFPEGQLNFRREFAL